MPTAFARLASRQKRSRRSGCADCRRTNEGPRRELLIDYLNGVDATAEYLLANESEPFVFPAPAYAEALAGEDTAPDGDVAEATDDLAWGEICETGEETAVRAGEIANEVGPQGPFLTGMDALIAAVGRELGAPVVSADGDLTHEATKRVIDVEAYRG